MRHPNTITALVIAATKWNWARRYLRSIGFHDDQIRYILTHIRDGYTMITGDVKYIRCILNLSTHRRRE